MSDALLFGQTSLGHLNSLLELESAPTFNFQSSDLLTKTSLNDVKRFALELGSKSFWSPGKLPEWMDEFLRNTFRDVPYFREFGGVPQNFETVPLTSRAELKEAPEKFVPDSVNLDEVTAYYTSGTTGTSITVPTDAAVTSKVLVLMERMLSSFGLSLARGPGKVAVAALFHQESTLTYPSLSHYLDGAAAVKLNLHPAAGWRQAEDRRGYLLELQPSLITGCPFSLSVLAELVPELRPVAIMNSAVALGEGLRKRLAETFECPVFDVYSLTESKYISADSGSGTHDLISPDLYVEILDEEGRVLPPGECGEICLTGGRNRCLPLVRYRTGDFAALNFRGRQPYFSNLQGRARVSLAKSDGSPMASLDVVSALGKLDIVGFSYLQTKSGFQFEYCGRAEVAEVSERLNSLTGWSGEVHKRDDWPGKPHEFRIQNGKEI